MNLNKIKSIPKKLSRVYPATCPPKRWKYVDVMRRGKLWKNISTIRSRGETITEVMVAIAMLVLIMTSVFGVLKNAISSNVNVRNQIVALNIAREGIEGVRNIRDTNWLKYSGDRRGKWLCHDTPENVNTCLGDIASESLLSTGTYKLDFLPFPDPENKEGERYFLVSVPSPADKPLSLEQTENNNPEVFEPYRLFENPETSRFTHITDQNYRGTAFHRQIELKVLNPFSEPLPTFCDGTVVEGEPEKANSCANGRMHVVSRVEWKEGKSVHSVTLETYLYDFYERGNY